MSTDLERKAYSLSEVATAVGCSVNYLRSAMKSTEEPGQPPRLKAKRGPKGYMVTARALEEWLESFPDA